jgi:hypothetical protein
VCLSRCEPFSELDALLERTGFAAAAARIHRLVRRCWHVLPELSPHLSRIGDSRLGGGPVLAAGSIWPRSNDGQLLAFFGQLRLSEIARLEPASGLPASGLLSLFAGDTRDFPIEARAVLTQIGTTVESLSRPPRKAIAQEQLLDPVTIRFEPGLSFLHDGDGCLTRECSLGLTKEDCPEGDFDALSDALEAGMDAPEGSIGQLLGHCPWTQEGDLRRAVHFEEIGRPYQQKLHRFESLEDWEESKKITHRYRNGRVSHPWSRGDDDNVRWILANRSVIAAGIEQWCFLRSIESNKHMDLWINDADPILFFAPVDESGRMDLSRLRAQVTQA